MQSLFEYVTEAGSSKTTAFSNWRIHTVLLLPWIVKSIPSTTLLRGVILRRLSHDIDYTSTIGSYRVAFHEPAREALLDQRSFRKIDRAVNKQGRSDRGPIATWPCHSKIHFLHCQSPELETEDGIKRSRAEVDEDEAIVDKAEQELDELFPNETE